MMPRGSRYPGVRTERLPAAAKVTTLKWEQGAVAQVSRVEERPYLCVSHDVEKTVVQPLRLVAGLVAGPLIVYAASQLPKERPVLRAATGAAGAGVSVWSLWIWAKANAAMKEHP